MTRCSLPSQFRRFHSAGASKALLAGLFVLFAICAGGQAEGEPGKQRYASVTLLKPDKVAYYKKLHARPWPEVTRQLAAMNIHNYSIYLIEAEKNKYYLFSYFEYTGRNFSADMKKFGQNAQCRDWLKETDPCQQVIPLGKKGQRWTAMEEIFHQK